MSGGRGLHQPPFAVPRAVKRTAGSSQAGRGSPELDSAAVIAPRLRPHLISDIVTTVARCDRRRNTVRLGATTRFNNLGTNRTTPRPLRGSPSSGGLLPGIGVTVMPLRSAAAAAAAQTMEPLSAQPRIINTEDRRQSWEETSPRSPEPGAPGARSRSFCSTLHPVFHLKHRSDHLILNKDL